MDHSIGKYLRDPVIQGKAPAMWAATINENGIEAIAAAGVRKRGSPEKASVDDQVHIGSLTKAMTSVLLARLVANGEFVSLTALVEPPMFGFMEPPTGADLGSRTG